MNRYYRSIPALIGTIALSISANLYAETQPTTAYVGEYLFEIVQKEPTIAKHYSEFTQALQSELPWLEGFGVATPGSLVTINDKNYVAFNGCEPHNCPQAGYVVILDPSSKTFVQGVVRQDSDASAQQPHHRSTLTWLSDYDEDFVPTFWQQLYPADSE